MMAAVYAPGDRAFLGTQSVEVIGLFQEDGQTVYEVMLCDEEFSSWFVSESALCSRVLLPEQHAWERRMF